LASWNKGGIVNIPSASKRFAREFLTVERSNANMSVLAAAVSAAWRYYLKVMVVYWKVVLCRFPKAPSAAG
jgi:hypothetical protein